MLQTEDPPKHGAAKRGASRGGAGPRASTRWLIARDGGGLEPLCVGDGDTRLLPVFSFKEEAEMFLRLGGYDGDGWQARESSAGEIVSVLYGPCADAGAVALDPLPAMLRDGTVGLVALTRQRFLKGALGGR